MSSAAPRLASPRRSSGGAIFRLLLLPHRPATLRLAFLLLAPRASGQLAFVAGDGGRQRLVEVELLLLGPRRARASLLGGTAARPRLWLRLRLERLDHGGGRHALEVVSHLVERRGGWWCCCGGGSARLRAAGRGGRRLAERLAQSDAAQALQLLALLLALLYLLLPHLLRDALPRLLPALHLALVEAGDELLARLLVKDEDGLLAHR
mmetsp:Transcript_44788/g.148451  ORF Transcript_44788/g.148451 Transcript_44788/m.148451 type:complete len:208 (-) Transcript_44788:90-713(-)